METNKSIIKPLFLVFLCAHQIGCESTIQNTSERDTTITILVDENIEQCHVDGLESALEVYESLWDLDSEIFKVYSSSKDSEEWKNPKHRTILFSSADEVCIKDKCFNGLSDIPNSGSRLSWTTRITMKNTECWNTELYVHELGHTFSLDHEDDEHNLMNPNTGQCKEIGGCDFTDEQVNRMFNFVFPHGL